eukprot:6182946-Pleurochrysis_carterae.AAC.2
MAHGRHLAPSTVGASPAAHGSQPHPVVGSPVPASTARSCSRSTYTKRSRHVGINDNVRL